MHRYLPWRPLAASILTIAVVLGADQGSAKEAAAAALDARWEAIFAAAPGEGPVNRNHARYAQYHEGYLKRKQEDQGAVVFLGDSITFHFDLKKAFPDLKTANRGISGDTTRGMLYRLQEEVLDLQPRLIVMLCGVNDLSEAMAGHGGTVQTLAGNVRLMLERISKTCPGTPVLVCEILPARKTGLKEANAAVDAVVAEFPQAHRFASHKLFLKADGTQERSYFTDGVHPNADGYRVLQEALAPELQRWLSLSSRK